jgi:heptaprenyl diphosphate synthase
MISDYDYTRENLKNISKAVAKICSGEIMQYNSRYMLNGSFKNYLRIISGKTATLFAISLYAGAKESNCDEELCKDLARTGYNIGMAFQIQDDLLDYTGDSLELGKSANADIKNGYYTLPLILGASMDPSKLIDNAMENVVNGKGNTSDLISIVEQLGGIKKAKSISKRYVDRAIKNIEKLPDCESKMILHDITIKLLNRKN